MSPQTNWVVTDMTCLKLSVGMLGITERIDLSCGQQQYQKSLKSLLNNFIWTLLSLLADLYHKYYHRFYLTLEQTWDQILHSFSKGPKKKSVIMLENIRLRTSRFPPILPIGRRESFLSIPLVWCLWGSTGLQDQGSSADILWNPPLEFQEASTIQLCSLVRQRDRGRLTAEGPGAPPQLTLAWGPPSLGCFYYHPLRFLDMRYLLS